MGLTIKVGEIRKSFKKIEEKYGYDEGEILKALYNQRVWSQDSDYRFACDLFNSLYECYADQRLADEDEYNLISGGLKAFQSYYKNENMIFKRLLNSLGILREEQFNINTDYFYELDMNDALDKIDEFIEAYQNLSELKRTIGRFKEDEFWKNPGYGTDVAFSYEWVHEILKEVIEKYDKALASDVYQHSIERVKKCALDVVRIQQSVVSYFEELNEYYKTPMGQKEMARCVVLGFNPLAELDKLSSNDFEMEEGKLKIVNNRGFYGEIEKELEELEAEEYQEIEIDRDR